jgi:hypothetical protein
MNARRRPRLFLDHKPPLVAFTVVAVACALMMVHMARSEAAPGWLRAGLGGVVGQQVIEATVLERDPAPKPATLAAGPLPKAVPSDSSAPPASDPPAAGPATSQSSSPADHGQAQASGAVVGAVVGEVVADHDDDSGPAAGAPNASPAAAGSEGQGHGAGRGEHPVPDVATPDASPAPQARDHHEWREDWVGDRGRGHRDHGHADHGHGHADHGHGHADHGHGHADHGHGHADHGHGHADHGHGHADHGHGQHRAHGHR